ncbi:sulfurtransferase [Planococcus beigongshangi]|uniref:sulfurtransferase n=1 Tax=Planococcus beigongshangi TaxID=2782536 RepID=UPI00193C736D|nr:sulfurtransferase [Planococcus beigongshangi]
MKNIPLIVTTEWLAERLDDPKLRIVDATVFMKFPDGGGPPNVESGRFSYGQGHIPGAVYADLVGELTDAASDLPFTVPARDAFVKKMTELGIGDDTYTVIYDQNALVDEPVAASYWASRLAWQLRYEGFEHIAILEGGLQKWQAEGRELSTESPGYPRANYTGHRRSEMLATKEDVRKAMDDEQTVLINSLSPEDFQAAHIPGSKNIFFGMHADTETKALYDEDKLRASFEKSGALDPSKKVITYCGGGIAATWNALMLNRLGQPNVAVYDGSMNEWTSDPSCPVIKGAD